MYCNLGMFTHKYYIHTVYDIFNYYESAVTNFQVNMAFPFIYLCNHCLVVCYSVINIT